MIHQWRQLGKNINMSQAQLRNAILNHPTTHAMLAKRINLLNLQGQINAGLITENQALKLFHDATTQFMRELNTRISYQFTKNQNSQNSQTDLSNPINMQNQLNTPGTVANVMMSDIVMAMQNDNIAQSQLIDSENQITNEIATQEASQQAAQDEEKTSYKTDDTSSDVTATADDMKKGSELAAGLKALDDIPHDDKEKAIEELFHKTTGIQGADFKGIEDEAAASGEDHLFKSFKPDLTKIVDDDKK